jgi:hypothetical protein
LVNLDVGNAIWGGDIPTALATAKFQVKPDHSLLAEVLKVQESVDLIAKGMSATKILVEISKDDYLAKKARRQACKLNVVR